MTVLRILILWTSLAFSEKKITKREGPLPNILVLQRVQMHPLTKTDYWKYNWSVLPNVQVSCISKLSGKSMDAFTLTIILSNSGCFQEFEPMTLWKTSRHLMCNISSFTSLSSSSSTRAITKFASSEMCSLMIFVTHISSFSSYGIFFTTTYLIWERVHS